MENDQSRKKRDGENTFRALATVAPTPLLPERSRSKGFPTAQLGPLEAAADAVIGRLMVPEALAATSALSIAALAVQGHVDVSTLAGPRPVSLYALTLAESGERKSSCDELLMCALRRREHEDAEARLGAMHRWRVQHLIWREQEAQIAREIRHAADAAAVAELAAALEALGPAPTPPPLPDRTTQEPTQAGLQRMFTDGLPALGLFTDEGGQFLGGPGMGRGARLGTMALLNSLWSGTPVTKTRATSGHSTLPGRRLSAHVMVQPSIAQPLLSDPVAETSGFLARWLICAPESRIGARFIDVTAPAADNSALEGFNARLYELLSRPLPIDPATGAIQPRVIPLSSDARRILIDFFNHIEGLQTPGEELALVKAHASKSAEQACRIAGVLAAWRDLDTPEVTPEEIGRGITLAQYYLSEALRLLSDARASQLLVQAERLRRWLIETWRSDLIVFSEVLQFAPLTALREKSVAEAAMALLERHGWVVPLPPGAVLGGKPRKRAWQIIYPTTEVAHGLV